MQAQFRTGQTEVLLTMIVVRACSGSIPPSAPGFSHDDYEDQTYILLQMKEAREIILTLTKPGALLRPGGLQIFIYTLIRPSTRLEMDSSSLLGA